MSFTESLFGVAVENALFKMHQTLRSASFNQMKNFLVQFCSTVILHLVLVYELNIVYRIFLFVNTFSTYLQIYIIQNVKPV